MFLSRSLGLTYSAHDPSHVIHGRRCWSQALSLVNVALTRRNDSSRVEFVVWKVFGISWALGDQLQGEVALVPPTEFCALILLLIPMAFLASESEREGERVRVGAQGPTHLSIFVSVGVGLVFVVHVKMLPFTERIFDQPTSC